MKLVIEYVNLEEGGQEVAKYMFTPSSPSWENVQPHLNMKLIWGLLNTKLKTYSPTDYLGRGIVYLLIPPKARNMIFANRNKYPLYASLGYGRRRMRACSLWNEQELEADIQNRLQHRIKNGSWIERS